MLLHTEYSLLSLLPNQDGVVHHHGLFQVNTVWRSFRTELQALCLTVPLLFQQNVKVNRDFAIFSYGNGYVIN